MPTKVSTCKHYFLDNWVHCCKIMSGRTYVEPFSCCLQGGYKGFYARNTIDLDPKVVGDIHKRGGTVLKSSRGGHDTAKIVDSIEDRGINQVRTFTNWYFINKLTINHISLLQHSANDMVLILTNCFSVVLLEIICIN